MPTTAQQGEVTGIGPQTRDAPDRIALTQPMGGGRVQNFTWAQAMDQAQIAREIARGNGFTTKMIRPVAYDQAQRAQQRRVDQ